MHTRCYFVMVNCNLMICELHYDRLYATQPKALPALRYIYMILMGKRVCLCIVQWQSIVIIACRLSSGLVWSGLVWPGLFCICAIDRSIDQIPLASSINEVVTNFTGTAFDSCLIGRTHEIPIIFLPSNH